MGRLLTNMGEALDERELVASALSGDRRSFDRLVKAHFGRVYAVLFRMVGNHEDAEDLAQECFVRAYRSLRFYRGEGAFGSWLMRIGLHLAQDHHRRRGRGAEEIALDAFEPELETPAEEPHAELSQREMVALIGRLVERLPHHLRAALVMRVLEGRDYQEVARATGLRLGTVRTQVMKARKLLLRWLEPVLERSRR